MICTTVYVCVLGGGGVRNDLYHCECVRVGLGGRGEG